MKRNQLYKTEREIIFRLKCKESLRSIQQDLLPYLVRFGPGELKLGQNKIDQYLTKKAFDYADVSNDKLAFTTRLLDNLTSPIEYGQLIWPDEEQEIVKLSLLTTVKYNTNALRRAFIANARNINQAELIALYDEIMLPETKRNIQKRYAQQQHFTHQLMDSFIARPERFVFRDDFDE